jgi:hypothetical protein
VYFFLSGRYLSRTGISQFVGTSQPLINSGRDLACLVREFIENFRIVKCCWVCSDKLPEVFGRLHDVKEVCNRDLQQDHQEDLRRKACQIVLPLAQDSL